MTEYKIEVGANAPLSINAGGFNIVEGHLLFYTGSVATRESVAAFAPGKWLRVTSKATTQSSTVAG